MVRKVHRFLRVARQSGPLTNQRINSESIMIVICLDLIYGEWNIEPGLLDVLQYDGNRLSTLDNMDMGYGIHSLGNPVGMVL